MQMLPLILKDFVAARWLLLGGTLLFGVQLATMRTIPAGAILFTFIFSASFAFCNLVLEEIQGTGATWCSLPVDRRQIVLARYATTILGVLLGLALGTIIGNQALRLLTIATIFFVLMTGASLFLPLYFRFGVGRALSIFALLWLGIIVLLAGAGALIKYTTDWLVSPEASVEMLGPYIAGLLILIAVATISTSALIAVRWYETTDC
jgi:hypothetical protein